MPASGPCVPAGFFQWVQRIVLTQSENEDHADQEEKKSADPPERRLSGPHKGKPQGEDSHIAAALAEMPGVPAFPMGLVHGIAENIRDLVSDTMDTYLSAVNNRMNEVMKTLTLITTLFMPLTLITGFFGMNFFEPVAGLIGWTSRDALYVTLLITALLPIGMYIRRRRRTCV